MTINPIKNTVFLCLSDTIKIIIPAVNPIHADLSMRYTIAIKPVKPEIKKMFKFLFEFIHMPINGNKIIKSMAEVIKGCVKKPFTCAGDVR